MPPHSPVATPMTVVCNRYCLFQILIHCDLKIVYLFFSVYQALNLVSLTKTNALETSVYCGLNNLIWEHGSGTEYTLNIHVINESKYNVCCHQMKGDATSKKHGRTILVLSFDFGIYVAFL